MTPIPDRLADGLGCRTLVQLVKRLHHFTVARKRNAVVRRMARFPRPYQLHLGCGTTHYPGWVNIDVTPYSPPPDVLWDLRYGLPVGDGSCRLIYSEHLLEHLAVADGVNLLRECRRALQGGGVVRIAMPSLDALIKRAHAGDWQEQDWLRQPDYQFIKTRAEMLNICFRWWGHQWLYDWEELHRRLAEAGFTRIRQAEWGRSDELDFCNLETRKDSLLIAEALRD